MKIGRFSCGVIMNQVRNLLARPSLEAFVKPVGKTETETEQLDRIQAKYAARAVTPMRAIHAFCIQCLGGQPRAVAHCPATACPLHPFRTGKNTLNPLYKKKESSEIA
jgi:hypothetical protein